jgi:type II secretory pathway pseudopilin PulG
MSKNSWTPCARTGITLIEVVAGLALLSTLLVSILAAYRGHAAQVRAAHDRLQAAQALDRLLGQWTASGQWPPAGSEEALTEPKDLVWRVVAEPPVTLQVVSLDTVRIEVARAAQGPPEVLASVTLLAAPPQ